MSYSYEYKMKCIEMYRKGRWPETPEGIKNRKNFRKMIRQWSHMEEANGPDILRHKEKKKDWRPDERLKLVDKVIAGESVSSVAIDVGIDRKMLRQWVQKYKNEGYNGLVNKKKGRKSKEFQMTNPNQNKLRKLEESEYEELVRLRAENESKIGRAHV